MRLQTLLGSMRVQMGNSFARPMFRFCLLVGPVANTILLYYMFVGSGRTDFMTHVILGAGLSSLWECICFSSIGDINRERWSGTLSLLFVSPTSFQLVLLGKIIGNTLLSLITLGISLLTAALLFGATLTVTNLPWLPVSAVAALCAFIAFSQLFAYLLTLSRKTTLYMNCLSVPIALVCGFVVPVEELPRWVWPLSYALPPTWAVKLIRGCFGGAEGGAGALAILLTQILLTVALCHMLFVQIERQVKIRATLELM